MALPYITERKNFKGSIYATQPTVQLGRLVIEELLDMLEGMDRREAFSNLKDKEIYANFINAPVTDPKQWTQLYSKAELEKCLDKIRNIYYCETIVSRNFYFIFLEQIFVVGFKLINGILRITACSSGYLIGSCNWIIQTEVDKIGYLAASSSRSSHTKEIDYKSLKDLDVMIMSSMSRWPENSPDSTVFSISETVIETLKVGGNVIFPIAPSGLIYDLFDLVAMAIEKVSYFCLFVG